MSIEGVVEEILPGRIRGWCYDTTNPNAPVQIAVYIDGTEVKSLTADNHRADLVRAGKGNGNHAFKAVSGKVCPTLDVQVFAAGSDNPLPILWNARTRVITSIEELDAEIEEHDRLPDGSLEQFNRRNAFYFRESVEDLPEDPLSPEYRMRQVDLYYSLTGKGDYNPWASEPIRIVVEHSLDPHPFPFSTKDPDCIGSHLIAVGHILLALKDVQPHKGASILEYGCGTGFTTILLAASGYDITAVDINAEALQVVDRLAETRGLSLTTFNGEFGSVPDEGRTFDIVVFYEAFHHCLDFPDLLITLAKRLKPHGAIIFAGEPIYEDFPKPWGLRMDGHAVQAIRKLGWLELGFNERFFCDIVTGAGFRMSKRTFDVGPPMFIARKT